MTEELIKFDTTKLAKECGFNWETKYTTDEYGNLLNEEFTLSEFELGVPHHWEVNKLIQLFKTPTQTLLQKWLREKHNIDVSVLPGWENGKRIYECILWEKSYDHDVKLSIMDEHGSTCEYKYEVALETGLYQALLLVKEKLSTK
jgi:hypothetical protein